MTRRRKFAFAAATLMLSIIGLELLLRLVSASDGQVSAAAAEFTGFSPVFRVVSVDGTVYAETVPEKEEWFNYQKFPQKKPEGTRRVFCLGGSTTYGRPYDDRTSFAGWLRAFLQDFEGAHRWEVINAGGISYGSARVLGVFQEVLSYDPDVLVVYTGHNEFLERTTYADVSELPDTVVTVGALLREYSAIGRTVARWTDSVQGSQSATERDADEVDAILDSSVGLDAYRRDPQWRESVIASFRENVKRMVRLAKDADVPVVFVTPACQLRDCRPFKSEFSNSSEEQRDRASSLLDSIERRFETEDWGAAAADARELCAIDPEFSLGHYLLGEALYRLGRYEEARQALTVARDTDVCPLRAIGAVTRSLRGVAAESGVAYVDFESYVADLSQGGIPGADLFLDHVHPTIEVNKNLALLLLQEFFRQGLTGVDHSGNSDAVARVSESVIGSIDQEVHATAIRNLSKVLSWAGKYDEADRLAIRAQEMLPEDAETQYQAGSAWFRRGDLENAKVAYENAVALAPRFHAAHFGLGLVFDEERQLSSAVAAYETAARLRPDILDIQFNLARAYELNGQLDKALRSYENCQQINPRFAPAVNGLGTVRARLGDLSGAVSAFRDALRIDPLNSEAKRNLQMALNQIKP